MYEHCKAEHPPYIAEQLLSSSKNHFSFILYQNCSSLSQKEHQYNVELQHRVWSESMAPSQILATYTWFCCYCEQSTIIHVTKWFPNHWHSVSFPCRKNKSRSMQSKTNVATWNRHGSPQYTWQISGVRHINNISTKKYLTRIPRNTQSK